MDTKSDMAALLKKCEQASEAIMRCLPDHLIAPYLFDESEFLREAAKRILEKRKGTPDTSGVNNE